MMNKMRRMASVEEGQAIVLVAIIFMALLFSVGLAIDAGQLYSAKRTIQEAADSAAFAGAVVLYEGGNSGQALAAAIADATRNGFTDGVNNTQVTVRNPPTSGAYSCAVIGGGECQKYVQVTITRQVVTSLVPAEAAFNPVTARGVGGASPTNSAWALMAVDPFCDRDALYNSNTLIVHGGSVLSNSCNSTKSADNNGGTVFLETGFSTNTVGGATGTWPNQSTIPLQPDPFAGVVRPPAVDTLGNPLPTYTSQCPPAINLPGIYTDTFSSNCEYVFAPGTYIFKGGGLSLAGSRGAACTGSACSTPTADGGVFFFFSTTNYPNSGGTCPTNPVKITGNSSSTLSPITDPTSKYKGMLIWIDSACGTNSSALLGGSGSITTTGSIYVPKGDIKLGGNGSVTVSQAISYTVTVSGNGGVNVNYDPGVTYQGFYPSLVD